MKFDLTRSSIRSRPPNRCRNSLLVCPLLLLGAGAQMPFPRASTAVAEPLFLSSISQFSAEWMDNKENRLSRNYVKAVYVKGWETVCENPAHQGLFQRGPGGLEDGWSRSLSE